MKFGFINVNKPSGVSSGYVVGKIKHLTGVACGHMGTLDPLASGVLPVAVGNATRLFDYMLEKKKQYVARFRFGVTSDTLDSTGNVEATNGKVPTREELLSAIPSLIGEIDQMPPKYSAKRVNGRHGYDLARAGKEFELQPKKITIYDIKLGEQVGSDEYSFTIDCGSGTYIRSIARDLGKLCGTDGIMTALTRTVTGNFSLDTAVELSDLTAENVEEYIVPTDDVIHYPTIVVKNKHIFNGLPQVTKSEDGLYKIYDDNGLYGIAEVKNGYVKIRTKVC